MFKKEIKHVPKFDRLLSKEGEGRVWVGRVLEGRSREVEGRGF